MIHPELLSNQGILIITPEGPLQKSDFENLALLVDPFIEAQGELRGILIHAESFPGWADFAAARYRRVILVECMTDWQFNTYQRKAELAQVAELWFVAEPESAEELKEIGYSARRLPSPKTAEFRDLKTSAWLCRPINAKLL